MKLSAAIKTGIAIMAIALAIPATASAQPSQSNNGSAASAHTQLVNGQFCWWAQEISVAVNDSGKKIGQSWLYAKACGPMRNIRVSSTCTAFRHWKCVGGVTTEVVRVPKNRHERKVVSWAPIGRQLTPGTAKGQTITNCFVVKRGHGLVGKCHRIPRPPFS